jgi:hypothetical protein
MQGQTLGCECDSDIDNAFTSGWLASPVTNGPLTALAGGGVYAHGSGNIFPSNSFNNSSYWVDVVYSP